MTEDKIAAKVARLELRAVETILDYLEREDANVSRAQIAQGAFSTIQRRQAAHNARKALELLMMRVGHRVPSPVLELEGELANEARQDG